MNGESETGLYKNVALQLLAANPDRILCCFSDRSIRRHQTEFMYGESNIPTCPTPCFKRYHSLIDYKALCERLPLNWT
jgi:hypothetical protein